MIAEKIDKESEVSNDEWQHFEMPISRFGKWAVGKTDFFDSETYPNFLSGRYQSLGV